MVFFFLATFFAGWQVGIFAVLANMSMKKGLRITEVGLLPGILAFIFVIIGAFA